MKDTSQGSAKDIESINEMPINLHITFKDINYNIQEADMIAGSQ